MSNVVVPFIPPTQRAAQENINAFIEFVKANAIYFRPEGVCWDDIRWDITPYFPKRGNTKTVAIFSSAANGSDPLPQPFCDQAKAILADHLRTTRDRQVSRYVSTLRTLCNALQNAGMAPSIEHVTDHILDMAAQSIATTSKESSKWTLGRLLETIAHDHIEAHRLSTQQLSWRSPFKWQKPTRSDTVSQPGRENKVNTGAMKLPQIKCVLDLASVFHKPKNPADIVTTAWFALAMFAPSRVTEIVTLPANCITRGDDYDEASTITGLSWRPLKGGAPMTKWAVSDGWAKLATEAVDRLIELGESARKAAAWYEENPTQLYLPAEYEHLRGQPVSRRQIYDILGASPDPHPTWLGTIGITATSRGKIALYDFAEVEKVVIDRFLPKTFPFSDPVTQLKFSEALFTIPRGAMRVLPTRIGKLTTTFSNTPAIVTDHMIKHDLGQSPSGKTIFWRHNLIDPRTSKPWKLSTHQPRHLLNTLAQSKYLSQELIAFWSGRKSVGQNEWYNHVPQEALIEAYTRMGDDAPTEIKVEGPMHDKCLARAKNEPISYDQALAQEYGSIHITRYGVCRHDYSLTPCPRDKDCIGCGENSFIKGDERHISEAKAQYHIHATAVDNCNHAISEDEPGVERWLDIHIRKLHRWETALGLMTDPKIEDGTLITLPAPENHQTKTGLTMEIRDAEGIKSMSDDVEASARLELSDDFFDGDFV